MVKERSIQTFHGPLLVGEEGVCARLFTVQHISFHIGRYWDPVSPFQQCKCTRICARSRFWSRRGNWMLNIRLLVSQSPVSCNHWAQTCSVHFSPCWQVLRFCSTFTTPPCRRSRCWSWRSDWMRNCSIYAMPPRSTARCPLILNQFPCPREPLCLSTPSRSAVHVVVVDRFYVWLFSPLEQTHCVCRMRFWISDSLFIACFWIFTDVVYLGAVWLFRVKENKGDQWNPLSLRPPPPPHTHTHVERKWPWKRSGQGLIFMDV